MKVNIICIGKLKEKYLVDAIAEYSKRLTKFCTLKIVELNEKVAKDESDSNISNAINEEGKIILSKIGNEYVVALAIEGVEITTYEFFEKMKDIKIKGQSEISFVIGGSYGLSNEVKKRANLILSFSRLTFPHQLFRVILLEQIYRVFKIENNEPYHK